MEINKTEIEFLKKIADSREVLELRELDLALVGGGTGDVAFS